MAADATVLKLRAKIDDTDRRHKLSEAAKKPRPSRKGRARS
jgi:hypothetical protein